MKPTTVKHDGTVFVFNYINTFAVLCIAFAIVSPILSVLAPQEERWAHWLFSAALLAVAAFFWERATFTFDAGASTFKCIRRRTLATERSELALHDVLAMYLEGDGDGGGQRPWIKTRDGSQLMFGNSVWGSALETQITQLRRFLQDNGVALEVPNDVTDGKGLEPSSI